MKTTTDTDTDTNMANMANLDPNLDPKTPVQKPAHRLSGAIKTNLLLDIGLLLAFLLVYEAHATGMTIHEWVGVTMGVALIAHLLLHWKWIIAFGKRFLHQIGGEIRLNYLVGVALFVSFTAVLFSGLMMSRSVLPLFGITASRDMFWHWLHSFTADVSLGLVALHLALHWTWVVNTVKQWVPLPRKRKSSRKAAIPASETPTPHLGEPVSAE